MMSRPQAASSQATNSAPLFDAFVSYNREDVSDVQSIARILEQRGGIELFIDSQIEPGQDWMSILTDKLNRCETFLFFIRNRPERWQLSELKAALDKSISTGKPYIIPALLPGAHKEAFFDNPNIALLRNYQAAQFSVSAEELDVIDSLARAIRGNSRVYVSSRALPRTDKLPSGFQADLGRLTDLLIGESVYQSNTVWIRELIQNARDACSRRQANRRPDSREPEVIINIDKENRFIDVIDFGDGMTKYNLTNSFSVLGGTLNDEFHNKPDAKQTLDHPVTGKFGVGFISTFMLSQKIVISTKSDAEPAYHFSMISAKDPFEYSAISQPDYPCVSVTP